MDMGKSSNRKLQAVETKQKIYTAAEQLFKDYGFENVSVDSIVEMAGVSKGGFYVHYDSKDSLIVSCINDYVNRVDLDYKSYLESFDQGAEASELLISLAGKITEVIISTIGHSNIKAVYKAHMTKNINTDAMLSYNRELYNIFNELINRGMEQGVFRTDIPVDKLTKHCIMAIRGLTYEWCIRYPDFDLSEQIREHFEILLSGMKAH